MKRMFDYLIIVCFIVFLRFVLLQRLSSVTSFIVFSTERFLSIKNYYQSGHITYARHSNQQLLQ